jgi:hypothetical protein
VPVDNQVGFLVRLSAFSLALVCVGAVMAQRPTAPREPDMVLANDKLELSIAHRGGAFTRLTMKDGDGLSPLHRIGHFMALDGFGAPSAEERAVGMPFHGEARAEVEVVDQSNDGPVRSITLKSVFPLAVETLMRTVTMVDGENVVYVSSSLESGIGVDRPISWAEHATIGGEFLEPGKTVVDMPATSCRVRPHKPGNIPGHLAYGMDFTWPMAPTIEDASLTDIRLVPTDHAWLDLASCLMSPSSEIAYVTALHLDKDVLFGYVFRRADYPWVMSWMNFTLESNAARGLEFSSQPFDVSRKETVAMNPLFGEQTFRWLPAMSKLETEFLFFYTKAPADVTRVDNVTLEEGKLVIKTNSLEDITINASRGLGR